MVLVVPKLVMRINGSFSHGQKQEQHGQHPCQQNKRKTSRIETVTCSHLLLLNHTQTHNGIEQAIGDAGTLHQHSHCHSKENHKHYGHLDSLVDDPGIYSHESPLQQVDQTHDAVQEQAQGEEEVDTAGGCILLT